jgi:hypothetical protein
MAHYLGEKPGCMGEAEGEHGELVKLTLPLESEEGGRVFVHVHVMVSTG